MVRLTVTPAGLATINLLIRLEGIRRVSPDGLRGVDGRYPAAPVPLTGGLAGWLDFLGSVDDGTTAVAKQFKAFTARCPDSKVVLAGYSQGAMVVHRNLYDLAEDPHVAAALLIADGDRLPADTTINLGSAAGTPDRGKGVAQEHSFLASTNTSTLPPAIGTRTVSVCDAGDPVCDYDPDASGKVSVFRDRHPHRLLAGRERRARLGRAAVHHRDECRPDTGVHDCVNRRLNDSGFPRRDDSRYGYCRRMSEHQDRQDISDLLVRYATGIDRRDWPLFRTVFTPDCHCDYGQIGVWDGIDAVAEFMDLAHAQAGHTLHRITNQVIDVRGDRATARCYVDVWVMAADNNSGVNATGFYDDQIVRAGDGWRIADRKFTSVRIAFPGPTQ